jgi:hypothetical protein
MGKAGQSKVELVDYKAYFKTKTTLKALQKGFKDRAPTVLPFLNSISQVIDEALSQGLKMPFLSKYAGRV